MSSLVEPPEDFNDWSPVMQMDWHLLLYGHAYLHITRYENGDTEYEVLDPVNVIVKRNEEL